MAKTSNVARRRRKKCSTRKKRGGGCVNSTCSSQPNEVNAPPPPPQNEPTAPPQNEPTAPQNEPTASQEENFRIERAKLYRFFNSKIIHELKNEHRDKISNLRAILMPITNDYLSNNLNRFEYIQRFLEAYNNFRIQEPELSRLFDLPDDIIKLEFNDNTFHDRDELINYLLEKEPAILNFLKENALNEILDNVKLKSQYIPENQELGGGRRKKTTRKKRGGGGGDDDEIINPMWEQQKVKDPIFTEEKVNQLIKEANKKITLLMDDTSSRNLTSKDMDESKYLITDLQAAQKAFETGKLTLNDEDKYKLKGTLGFLREWYSWRIDPVVRLRRGGRKSRKLYKKKTIRKKRGRRKKTTRKKRGGGGDDDEIINYENTNPMWEGKEGEVNNRLPEGVSKEEILEICKIIYNNSMLEKNEDRLAEFANKFGYVLNNNLLEKDDYTDLEKKFFTFNYEKVHGAIKFQRHHGSPFREFIRMTNFTNWKPNNMYKPKDEFKEYQVDRSYKDIFNKTFAPLKI
jgi:hypothetical protein